MPVCKIMKTLELLAPAGNMQKMKTAFAHGADAVYLGIPDFSLRVRINDFGLKEIAAAIKYAHARRKKVYVTINIFAHNEHIKKLPAYIKKLKTMGADALIISDPGIVALVKRIWPRAEIHLSTQANCTNVEAVKFWAKQGIKRIILGREVTLKEIKEIHQALPKVELEYFIHGAMCMAYSGRCFLSKLLVGRSGNLGDCAQPCRWEYGVKEYSIQAKNHPEEMELVEERHGAYILNSKDLCLIKQVKELADAGVISFKIEGRAKSVYYQATVVGIYRQALNLLNKKISVIKLKKELARLYSELETKLVHRGYTSGFLLGDKADQNVINSHQPSAWEFCGQTLEEIPKAIKFALAKLELVNPVVFQVHNTVKVNEEIEVIRPGYDIIRLKPLLMWNAISGEEITEAHGGSGQIAVLDLPAQAGVVPVLSVLRRLIA